MKKLIVLSSFLIIIVANFVVAEWITDCDTRGFTKTTENGDICNSECETACGYCGYGVAYSIIDKSCECTCYNPCMDPYFCDLVDDCIPTNLKSPAADRDPFHDGCEGDPKHPDQICCMNIEVNGDGGVIPEFSDYGIVVLILAIIIGAVWIIKKK